MKAISTVIATILMLAITIALAGTAYLYISGALAGKISTSFSLVYSYTNTVTIRNDGTAPITSFTKVTVDGKPAIYSVTAQDSSLAGYWKFDEGYPSQTASDSSDKGNIGTLGSTVNPDTNDPSWASKSGSALQFDGSNDYVQIVNSPTLGFTSFTLELWVYLKESGRTQRWINGGNAFYDFRLTSSNDFNLEIWNGLSFSQCTVGTSPTLFTNRWYHIVATHDGSTNQQRIYLNGSQIGATCTFTASPRYGNIFIGGNQVNEYFKGIIDEVRIYNRALSLSEVQSRFQGQDIRSGLVAELSFNEASGTKTSDSSGNNNNGDLLPAGSAPAWTSRYGSALSFDGVNDYANNTNGSVLSFGDNDFTVMGWFKRINGTVENGQLISKFGNGASFGVSNYEIYWGDYGANPFTSLIFGARWTYASGLWCTISSNTVANNGVWYHFALVHSGSNMIFYVNGAQTNSGSDCGTISAVTNALEIGRRNNVIQYFNGTIDEVRIYNRALSAGEISAVYQSNFGDVILPGSAADVKILTPLSTGTRTVKICTPSICNTAYLIIT